MKKITLFASALLILSILAMNISVANADGFAINLFYNAKSRSLYFDKQSPQNVIWDKSVNPSILDFANNKTPGAYILKLYTDDTEIVSTEFNKQDGAFQLVIPYFSLATQLKIFEKSSGKELLTADLSAFSTCDGNGICELEKGETNSTCIGDCGTSRNSYSDQTKAQLEQNNGIIKDPNTGDIILKDSAFSKSSALNSFPAPNQNTPSNTTTSNSAASSPYLVLVAVIILVALSVVYIRYRKRKTNN